MEENDCGIVSEVFYLTELSTDAWKNCPLLDGNSPSGVRGTHSVLVKGTRGHSIKTHRYCGKKPKFFSNHTLLSEATQRGGAG